MIVDLKRTYLEMRPDLLRVYDTADADGPLAPMVRALGFVLVPGGRSLGPLGARDADRQCRRLDRRPHRAGDLGSTRRSAPTADPSRQLASLSAREREVLAALADGLTNQELAERLFISERTANRHLSNIFTKLGVRNRTAAARVAIEAGLAG